jgi:heme/copper-type cytochrome/quinol oxidase subunit 3
VSGEAQRGAVDVRQLPTTVFGHRDPLWWGTMGFIVIEGTTLLIAVASYFYLWRNTGTWPPEHTLRPSLLWPTISAAVLLLSNIPMYLLNRAAHRLDVPAVKRWLLVATLLSLVFLFLRWQDFLALNVRWDANAYGSIAWFTVGLHATLLAATAGETAVFTALYYSDRRTERHFGDATDLVVYWYFMTGVWVPLYGTVYLGPYLI